MLVVKLLRQLSRDRTVLAHKRRRLVRLEGASTIDHPAGTAHSLHDRLHHVAGRHHQNEFRCVSDVLPSPIHDLKAAREPVLAILWPYATAVTVLADSDHEDAGCGALALIKRRTDGIRSTPTSASATDSCESCDAPASAASPAAQR